MAIQHITHFSIFVDNQENCLSWYRDKLGFAVCDDNSKLVSGFRWLTIAPIMDRSTQFVLVPASNEDEKDLIGNNGMCVLSTDSCYADCELFAVRGVDIVRAPEKVPWGISAIINDLYGNPYTIVELNFA